MINLLPDPYKKAMRQEEQFRLVFILGMLLAAFFVCLSLLLLAVRISAAGQTQAQQILVESQKGTEDALRSERIRTLNEEIAQVSSFYEGRVSLSELLERISNALPQSISLTSLSYTQGTPKGKITLKGFAPRTEDLLELQTNLEKDPLVENLRIPPANWARATHIDFSLDFELR